MDKFLIYIVYFLVFLVTILPLRVLYTFANLFYLLIYYIFKYRKYLILKNLSNSFPEKTEKEIKKIAKKFYKHFCNLFVETFYLMNVSDKEMNRRISYKNIELLESFYNKGQSIVLIFGHYGNWEWAAYLASKIRFKTFAIYKVSKKIHMDKFVNSLRSRFGVEMLGMKEAFKVFLDNHKKGIPTISYFLCDQRPVEHEIQYWTTFLNQDTPIYLGPEKIAKRMNQAVVFMDVKCVKRGYYDVEFILITDEPNNTANHEITEKHVRLLENRIKENPEYWLWSHNRWKFKKKEND